MSSTAPTSELDSSDPLASIPPLDYVPATDDATRTAGLKLVMDSIAQQRQIASKTAIFSPLLVSVAIALLGITYSLLYKSREDWPLIFTTFAGEAMSLLVLIRWLVSPYINLAESLSASFLEPNDEVLVATFGKEIIGSVVYRIDALPSSPGGGRKRKEKKVGVVRAWTVRRRERGRGVGRGLLEEVTRICVKGRGCEGVEFENETRPGVMRGVGRLLKWMGSDKVFEANERRAKDVLKEVVREVGAAGRRRGSR